MKRLYMIGGPMGIGKTSVGIELKKKLRNSVFLDGDWCWDADPFQVTCETKSMVLSNICYLLNNFIHCTAYENIIFTWVMHEQDIIDDILSKLDLSECMSVCISLVACEKELRMRLEKDIVRGKRSEDVIERSIKRLPLYSSLDTHKIDTGGKTVEKIADEIIDFGQKI